MKRYVLALSVIAATISGAGVYYWSSKPKTVDLSSTQPEGVIERIQWYDEVCTVITENRERAKRFSKNPYTKYTEAWAHREIQALQEWAKAGEFDRARQWLAKLEEVNRSAAGIQFDRIDNLAAQIELGEAHSRCAREGRAPETNLKRLRALSKRSELSENPQKSAWLKQYVEQLSANPHACDQYGTKPGKTGLIEKSQDAGLSVLTRAGGVITEDLDADGQLDVVVSSHGFQEQLRILIGQNGNQKKWVEKTVEMGLEGMPGGLNIVQADYDNDGWMDLYISRGGWLMSKGEVPDSLLKNINGERFRDVTEEAGLWVEGPTQVAQWQDYNGDGHLDLFVGYESQAQWSMSTDEKNEIDTEASVLYPNKLFKNRGDGTFEEVADEVGLTQFAFVKGASWGQLVGDEYPDLLISIYGGENLLYENIQGKNGERVFHERKRLKEPVFSFASWVWDINHDGLDDIFIANFRLPMENEVAPLMGGEASGPSSQLYINRGHGKFENVSEKTGLNQYPMSVMGANFGDIDNDGYFDAFFGTGTPSLDRWVPNRLLTWENKQRRFVEHTKAFNLGVMDKGHGIAFADLNNDGRQDIYASFGGWFEADQSRNRYFENQVENDNHWVQLILEGDESNRSAIGARVEIRVVDVEGIKRSFYHTVNSGGSFGADSLMVSAGLGEIDHIEEVVVTWPRKGFPKQRYQGVESNQRWRLVESAADPRPVP